MSNSDDANHREDKGLQLDNVLKIFASSNGNENESKSDNISGIEKSAAALQRTLQQSSTAKNFNLRSKHAKLVDRKVTALDEYIAEKDINHSNRKLDDTRDELCTEFAEVLHRKCRKRILNVVVDEQTGLMLRRALTALQTGKDVDGSQDTAVSMSGSEMKITDIDQPGNPVLFSQSIIFTQQLPGNTSSTIAYRRKMSANQMKRTPTNRLTKYD